MLGNYTFCHILAWISPFLLVSNWNWFHKTNLRQNDGCQTAFVVCRFDTTPRVKKRNVCWWRRRRRPPPYFCPFSRLQVLCDHHHRHLWKELTHGRSVEVRRLVSRGVLLSLEHKGGRAIPGLGRAWLTVALAKLWFSGSAAAASTRWPASWSVRLRPKSSSSPWDFWSPSNPKTLPSTTT